MWGVLVDFSSKSSDYNIAGLHTVATWIAASLHTWGLIERSGRDGMTIRETTKKKTRYFQHGKS